MMQSEDSTQDSVGSQNVESVNGGNSEDAYFVQQGEDSSHSSGNPGGKMVDDTARDGMYSMQEYYNPMQFAGSAGVAMAGIDSDNSNSRGFGTEEQAQMYAEMMIQMQQQQQPQADDSNEGNDTRDSSNSTSHNAPNSVNGNSNGDAMIMETSGQQSVNMEGSDSEQSGGKRKLAEEGESENIDEANDTFGADGSNNSNSPPAGPTPAKKALLEINVRKLLPDLEKHWKPVEDDPNDFQAWTYLLQYVDQEVRTLHCANFKMFELL